MVIRMILMVMILMVIRILRMKAILWLMLLIPKSPFPEIILQRILRSHTLSFNYDETDGDKDLKNASNAVAGADLFQKSQSTLTEKRSND